MNENDRIPFELPYLDETGTPGAGLTRWAVSIALLILAILGIGAMLLTSTVVTERASSRSAGLYSGEVGR